MLTGFVWRRDHSTRARDTTGLPRGKRASAPPSVCRRISVYLLRKSLCPGATTVVKERSDPNGIRTRVTAVKGRCPRPLDDRVEGAPNIGTESHRCKRALSAGA